MFQKEISYRSFEILESFLSILLRGLMCVFKSMWREASLMIDISVMMSRIIVFASTLMVGVSSCLVVGLA